LQISACGIAAGVFGHLAVWYDRACMNFPLTIAETAAAFRRGSLTPLTLVAGCLARIDRLEPKLSAWVSVDQAGALLAAERCTRELADGRPRGPLHGIPIGIKDIVDVAGWPTLAGSTLTATTSVEADATVVGKLRAVGAIILGKTVTTEFACFDPSPTKNPWNAARTPGGSSSGSAVALAAGMCLGAIGSQTGGSINRPASYCGVAGFKPSYGRVSRAGVTPVSFHLDHVGAMARTATDCGLLLAAIAGPDPRDAACSVRPGFELPDERASWTPERPPRLGLIRPYFFETAEHDAASLAGTAIDMLADQGAKVVELPLPEFFGDVHTMHRRIMACEAAEYHRATYGFPRDGYGPQMRLLLDEGLAVSMSAYQAALKHRLAFRNAIQRSLAEVDALILPATPGPPPDPSTTGDGRFNSPWSHAGVPSLSMPCAINREGLPVALQLVGEAWGEEWLLQTATWCEKKLRFLAVPPLFAE
jgi:aspartyl-tRNA(Asn)/glutamyl-tRNA(Gln) amidotransferase subunit A